MVKTPIKLSDLSEEDTKRFREKYDYFFFDMDGTIEQFGAEALPGIPDALAAIQRSDKTIFVYTDSSLFNKKELAKRIHRNFPYIKEDNIITASLMVVEYLKKLNFSQKVYLLGGDEGIGTDLKNEGFDVVTDRQTTYYTIEEIVKTKFEDGIGAVVVSQDFNYSYLKLMKAVNYLVNPDVLFLTTYIHPSAKMFLLLPTAASMTIPITAITKRVPVTTGKSEIASVDYIHSLGYDMERCLFVGDGLESDIKCGNKCGMDTLLVLSGDAKEPDLQQYIHQGDEDFIPTYVTNSAADLLTMFS